MLWSALSRLSNDEGKLKWLLNELQMSEQRHLVPYLESAVEELLGNLHQLQEEKSRLEDTWRREKLEHEKHLKRMEEELDNQVKEAELKMRLKAQEQVEDERKTLQSRMDSELDKLQSHLVLMEKVYSWLRTQPTEQRDIRLDEVRTKLDEAVHENRQLRMSLLDTQTSIALMRSELLQLRTMYEEKCRELSSERERILEVLQEQDHLSRQLNLLHDANKRLLDSHDALRNNVEIPCKQGHQNLYRCKSGSVIGDYLDPAYSYDIMGRFQEEENDEDNESCAQRRPKSMDNTYTYPIRRRPKPKDRQLGMKNFSSRILARIECYKDRELISFNSQDSLIPGDTLPRRKISDIKKQLGIEDKPASWNRSMSPNPPLQCSTPKERLAEQSNPHLPTPMPRTSKINCIYESIDSNESLPDNSPQSELNNNSIEVEELYEPSGPPEKTFKVIFVGDAGVGKSSFALRISKGVFVRHMSSTLGLDFLMRHLRVDGKNVAVQLWDTAGQERFRSITKTYFRKADGVMLLYDCTCEQSFLNVRQWVEDIDKSSTQRIPLMIVANKIDLREMAVKTGTTCVTTEQGERLAKDCDTTFMEASAKEGSNVLHALANLVRSMITRQDLQLSASTMQLCEAKPKKSMCCGGK
ncbi:ras and EF-hand domain-containing protein [Trichonephila inaurata madagascariensis]|uniref:Ras and EF-hand domain-containing protein n=1 Tax=Trichonephila inaurata madagascariensis TaxID=2747483 RepID=A0A8X6MJC8_9ARAC|nr:ras and EF-hand domain-containing protein [Trichonephila inaurata madagascariensis]